MLDVVGVVDVGEEVRVAKLVTTRCAEEPEQG